MFLRTPSTEYWSMTHNFSALAKPAAPNLTDMEEYIAALNVRRVLLAALVTLALQLVNALNPAIQADGFIRLGVYVLAGLSLLCVGFLLFADLSHRFSAKVNTCIAMAYWVLTAIAMGPFFLTDAHVGGTMPVNTLLFFFALATIPVLHTKKIVMVYLPCTVIAVLSAGLAGAGWMAVGMTALVCLMSFGVAYVIQNGFLNTLHKLQSKSETDQLTQMYNKASGIEHMLNLLAICKRSKRKCAVFFADIDNFKCYNDTYGHLEGDKVLRRVAGCIRQNFRRKTDILSRIGGEEFCIMAYDITRDGAIAMAQALSRSVAEMGIRSGDGAKYETVTVSIGIAILEEEYYEADIETMNWIIDLADQQLYLAKSSKRNCIAINDKILRGVRVLEKNASPKTIVLADVAAQKETDEQKAVRDFFRHNS